MNITVSFYCKSCGTDFDLRSGDSRNDCHRDKLFTGEEFWYGLCPKCGHKCIRYITNMAADPYFVESHKLQVQRLRLHKDLIQPGSPGFQTYYKKQYERMQATEEALDKKKKKASASRLEFYKEHSHNVDERRAAVAVIEAEERNEALKRQ